MRGDVHALLCYNSTPHDNSSVSISPTGAGRCTRVLTLPYNFTTSFHIPPHCGNTGRAESIQQGHLSITCIIYLKLEGILRGYYIICLCILLRVRAPHLLVQWLLLCSCDIIEKNKVKEFTCKKIGPNSSCVAISSQ